MATRRSTRQIRSMHDIVDPGELDTPMTLHMSDLHTVTKNALGERTYSTIDKPIRCKVIYRSAREEDVQTAIVDTSRIEIICRYVAAATHEHTISDAHYTYKILGIEPLGRRRYMRCTLQRLDNPSMS